MESTKEEYNYKVDLTMTKKIENLVTNNRFEDKDEFIKHAIDVFFAWETEPSLAMAKMMEKDPTLKQYVQMVEMGMDFESLKMMYPFYPDEFGEDWTQRLAKDPTLSKKFKNSKSAHNTQSDSRAEKDDYLKALSEKTQTENFLQLQTFSDDEKFSKEYHYDGWPLLFNNYSRLFPARIAVLALADSMKKTQNRLISFDKFNRDAYDFCEEIAINEIKREKEESISREHKTSTGLPKPNEKLDEDQNELEKSKQEQYESRYKEKYFGKIKENKEEQKKYFEGLMSSLNLIRIIEKNDELYVTFTEEGRELWDIENPLFSGDRSKVFSEKEGVFILEKLIYKRKLEIGLMRSAINLIKLKEGMQGENFVSQLDEQFTLVIEEYCNSTEENKHTKKLRSSVSLHRSILENRKQARIEKNSSSTKQEKEEFDKIVKKQSPIEAVRIATMGRMAELNLVKWNISDGKSYFEEKNQNLIDVLKNLTEK